MEHPGVLKKWHAEFPSVDQKRSGISRGDKVRNLEIAGVFSKKYVITSNQPIFFWNILVVYDSS